MKGVIDLERAVGRDWNADKTTVPRRKTPGRYTPADYVAHIRFAGGIAAAAARNMGLTRSSISHAAARHPQIRAALEEERETLGDLLEQKIFKKAAGDTANPDGDTAVQMFLLTTIFRDRGYVQRSEINLAEDIKHPALMTNEELLEANRQILAGFKKKN